MFGEHPFGAQSQRRLRGRESCHWTMAHNSRTAGSSKCVLHFDGRDRARVKPALNRGIGAVPDSGGQVAMISRETKGTGQLPAERGGVQALMSGTKKS